jgi:hypothetical protein
MKSDAVLRRAPGIDAFVDLTDVESDTVRGLAMFQDTAYALVGETLSSITANGTTATIGTVPGGERVRMVENNEGEMVIWRPFDNTLYVTDGASVSQDTDPMLADGIASPVFLDGYIVGRRPNTPDFFNSGLNEITWDGLDIASAEAQPGNLIGVHVDHRELFLAKANSIELWYNAANDVGSPFSRSPNGFLDIGTAAGESFGSQDNSPFWLGSDLTIRRLQSSSPERVSQHGIEAILAREQVSDAYAVNYFNDGHLCIAWIMPFSGRTIVYDCTAKQWHERDSLGYGAWRPSHIIPAYGGQLVGDRVSGKIGFLNPDTNAEFGEPQRVKWTYQPVYAKGSRAVHKRLEIIFNAGNGLVTGQGVNPLATLKISDDGGNIFRTHTTRSLGALGRYKTRAVWWKLGQSANRVYQLEITDPVPVFTFDTQLEAPGARL